MSKPSTIEALNCLLLDRLSDEDYQKATHLLADLRYNQMKNSGELQALEDQRAMDEQLKWQSPDFI
jgi:hypothetical protein